MDCGVQSANKLVGVGIARIGPHLPLKPALHASPLHTARDLFGAVTFASRDGALTLHTGTRRGVTLDDSRSGQDVVAAAVSNYGNRVLVAEKKKTIKLYDLSASHQPLARFEVPGVE